MLEFRARRNRTGEGGAYIRDVNDGTLVVTCRGLRELSSLPL